MSGQGLLERILNDQSIVTGMLIVIAVCSLTFAYRHLRPASLRHLPSHSRGPAAVGGRWTGGDPWMSPPPGAAAGNPRPAGRPEPAAVHPAHAEDHPSWPGRSGSGAVHSDHPAQPVGRRPGPAVPAPGPAWDAGSVQLATWILDEANAQAAEIRNEARGKAAASLADARKEAARLSAGLGPGRGEARCRRAEAAEVQAAVMKLSSELSEAAAQVTTRLPGPAPPCGHRPSRRAATAGQHVVRQAEPAQRVPHEKPRRLGQFSGEPGDRPRYPSRPALRPRFVAGQRGHGRVIVAGPADSGRAAR